MNPAQRNLRDPALQRRYASLTGAVTFVDESIRLPVDSPQARPFYLMAGVTFDHRALEDTRARIVDLVDELMGERFWHSTEAHQVNRDDAITTLASHVAETSTWGIVTVETKIEPNDPGGQLARQACLGSLARHVSAGGRPEATHLIVADRSAYAAVNDLDQALIRRMRSRGSMPRDVALYHGRMSTEPLLWTADVVAWSVRRTLTHDETYRLADLHDALTIVEPRTGKILNMTKPQAGAVAEPITPGAREPVGPSRAGGALVPSSVDPTPDSGNGRVLADLAARAAQLRELAARDRDTRPPPPTPHVPPTPGQDLRP
ncbi:hypothetical protein [Miniimonas sp. S16]|uniref:hypothetical protein n=1 Tax=Miniimonas sp. S16 TaxID=2171623 RepID=UPI000D529CC8|nr:hypothetical protein [Miniimonas sp. S16]